jgi:predicted phosphate transport protein (TIGR00153 family)
MGGFRDGRGPRPGVGRILHLNPGCDIFPANFIFGTPHLPLPMKFDTLLTFLMPKNDKFFAFFEATANNLVEATELLKKLPTTPHSERAALIKQIEDREHRGDSITHDIMSELNATFITPFDREDIHQLASSLDDILDNLYGAVVRFQLYRVKDVPPDMVRLIEVLDRSVRELHRGIHMIRDLHKRAELANVLKTVNECENEADTMFEQAVADLFENEKDPINIIKLKEIYVGLETATDKCEDAANVIEGLLVKHS